MKTNGFEDGGILTTGTRISDPHAWFISLVRQVREILKERRNPPPAIARSRQIASNDSEDQDIFATGTRISDSNPWFLLLTRQIRETLKERRNPTPRAVITAQSDPGALDKLVDPPFQIASLFSLVKAIISDKLHPHHIEITAKPVEVEELWTKRKYRVPAILSVLTHAGVVGALLYLSVTSHSKHKSAVDRSVLMEPVAVYLLPSAVQFSGGGGGGGGGGGAKAPTPASKGVLPGASDKQLAPPAPIIKNMAPELMAEMTIIAQQVSNLPNLSSSLLPVGDPNGVIGPSSAGSGTGFGIGNGDGHGIGAGNGPGFGPGSGGGIGDGPYRVGRGEGKASSPVCNTVDPNYSDEARKAHIQGTVVLDSIVQKDGSIDVSRVLQSVGYGLDDEARKVLRKWKCDPGKVNGQAVPVQLQIVINFHLY